MFKPVTSRLDTQIEATKKLENKGVREGDPLPPPPINETQTEDEDEYEMPDFDPPPPINETQTEDEDEYEMPDFDPPPPIDEAQTEDEDEMPDFDPPPSIERKRKEWDPSSLKKADQKELDRQRKSLAEERRRVSVLLGKLKKSGKNMIKSGKYKGKSYNDLLEIDEDFTNQIDRIENQLLLTKHKIQRMEYKRVPFSASDLQEKSKKLKKTPKKTKYKKKPTIEESLFDKIDAMRRDTAPDSDREDDEWDGGGLANNYKAIYYRDPEKLIEKLDIICGSISAGNTSYELKNQGGKKPYDGNDLHKICFIKGLLEFSDDYSRTVATNFNWYLDDRAALVGNLTTAPKVGAIKRGELCAQSKDVYACIPLNRFSIFQELRDKMIPPMQIELNITLNDDREFIYRVDGDETRSVEDILKSSDPVATAERHPVNIIIKAVMPDDIKKGKGKSQVMEVYLANKEEQDN
ncbi:hypothetical protein ACROYT_G030242 [Oculina patagonica]